MSEGEDKLLAGLKDVSESALQNMANDVVRCSERMDGITRFSGVVAHDVNNLSVSYTHLTLPTNREV